MIFNSWAILNNSRARDGVRIMQEILQNLALIHLNEFGKAHGINISGTHGAKNGRGFKYSLVKSDTGLAILTITFHKHSVPTYTF